MAPDLTGENHHLDSQPRQSSPHRRLHPTLLRRPSSLVRSRRPRESYLEPTEPASGAAMLNSGNFVLLNSARRVVWSTFAIPTNTIVPGQTLQPNSQLISSSSENNPLTGKFRLTNQNDGNLVLYPMHTTNTADDAYWDSGTFQIGFLLTLNLADNGVLFLSGNNSAFTKNLTQSTTSQKPSVEIYYRAVIDVDGILRVYYHSLTKNVSWETGIEWAALTDKCLVKGVCGLSSYCSLLDGVNGEQSCLCPSGFSFVDSNQRTLGCTKNYTGGDCMKDDSEMITMVVMKNTTWVDKTYSILSSSTTSMDECEAACLNDCFCMAALFKSNGECSKQLLPLRYGRVGGNDTVFIKVGVMPNSGERRGSKTGALLVMTLVFAALFLVVFLGFLLLVIRGRRRHHDLYVKEEEAPLKSYSYEELENATNGFREELGRGAFGVVFKGELSKDGKHGAIAVKKLQKNILIDKSGNAKISDFGLSKLLMPEQTKTFTGIRGTRGYLAPEWQKNAAITVKADVFSFGVLLFEIICCRRNMEMEEGLDCTLAEWVYECFEEGHLNKVLTEEVVEMEELERMVKVGFWCVQSQPGIRPSMKDVLIMLEGNNTISPPPPPSSFS
ncbi:hypothetical protein J5N97_012089 [Dioscorea zingiberensis]|uniref:Protein kinase domain-containing protein n=1 Tax=Dioscorea zingiberensis TaxID=325984 RepID=A0A9D5CQU8_9LILI|nr:hypothetical protein J5N97_012089 [Dioscorea zingiberensis]